MFVLVLLLLLSPLLLLLLLLLLPVAAAAAAAAAACACAAVAVWMLKEQIRRRRGVPADRQRLSHEGVALADDRYLGSYRRLQHPDIVIRIDYLSIVRLYIDASTTLTVTTTKQTAAAARAAASALRNICISSSNSIRGSKQ